MVFIDKLLITYTSLCKVVTINNYIDCHLEMWNLFEGKNVQLLKKINFLTDAVSEAVQGKSR